MQMFRFKKGAKRAGKEQRIEIDPNLDHDPLPRIYLKDASGWTVLVFESEADLKTLMSEVHRLHNRVERWPEEKTNASGA